MLRAAFLTAALDAGVPLRDVQLAARHRDPYDHDYDRRRRRLEDEQGALRTLVSLALADMRRGDDGVVPSPIVRAARCRRGLVGRPFSLA